MLAAEFESVSVFEQFVSTYTFRRDNIRYNRHAACYGSGLIQNDYLRSAGLLQRSCRFEQDPVLCGNTVADHYRYRCRKTQSARAAHYKN